MPKAHLTTTTATATSTQPIRVWDAVVRVGHWTLAASFLTAYFTAESESLRLVHTTSGLVALAVVVFRIVWGFAGPPPARFSNFIKPPAAAWVYLKSLTTRHPEHHTSHNPAGGWAVLGLLGLTLLTALTGLANYNDIGGNITENAHDLLANLSLVLVIVHVCAVVLSTYLHRENLIKAMFTGTKQGFAGEEIAPRTGWIAVLLLLMWTGTLAWWLR